MTTLLATGAVLASWLVLSLLLVGLGLAVRRGIVSLARLETAPQVCSADLWTGLAALTAYLLGWSLFAGIGPRTWVVPCVVAGLGLLLLVRTGPPRHASGGVVTIVLLGLVVWLANLSLGDAGSYDSGLGPFGSAATPAPETRPLSTDSGLTLLVPTVGDQCWSTRWCTPAVNPSLELRRDAPEDGFRWAR